MLPYHMDRTKDFDKKFAGFYYCNTCGHYVCNLDGIVGDHTQHDFVAIPEHTDKQEA